MNLDRRRRLGVALIVGIAAGSVRLACPHGGIVAQAFAQEASGESDLAAARKLFTDGVKDEDAGLFEAALEKFRRVKVVRDTANVRYRIATCLEATGRRASALAAYQGAIAIGTGDKSSLDAVRESTAKVAQLEKAIAHLSLVLSPRAPSDTVVQIDGEKIPSAALSAPIAVDPGAHAIRATASGATPFETSVTLPEGGDASLTLALDPQRDDSGSREARLKSDAVRAAPLAKRSIDPPRANFAVGTATTVAGGLLLGASFLTLLFRSQNIDEINAACPGGACPLSRAGDLSTTRDRAVVEGPVGAALGLGGLVALSVGIYFLVKPPMSTPQRTAWTASPLAARGGAGMTLQTRF